MTHRTPVLLLTTALVAAGAFLTVRDLLRPAPRGTLVPVAYAATQIEPYSFLAYGQVRMEEMPAAEASAQGVWRADQLEGLMATHLISPGEPITGANAEPVEQYRLWPDMGLELISLGAAVDHAAAGDIRPGHLVNVYGYSRAGDDSSYTRLVEPFVRVVSVHRGSGQGAGPGQPSVDLASGSATFADPHLAASILVVAVPPETARKLIDAFGADGLAPYVTISGRRVARAAAEQPPRGADLPTPAARGRSPEVLPSPTPLPVIEEVGGGGTARDN